MNIYKTFTYCLALILISSCGTRENDPVKVDNANLALALQEAIDNSVIPTVTAFKTQASDLEGRTQTFCTNTTVGNLASVQQSWRTLFHRWYQLANYNIGPLNDDALFPKYPFIDSMRENGQVYTGTVRDDITDIISGAQSSTTLNEAYFDQKLSNRVGLVALEILAFETSTPEHSNTASDIVLDYQNNPRKCDILKGLALQILKHANYVENGWKNQAKDSNEPYRTLFLNNQLADGTNNLTELIVSVQNFLDYMQRRSVATRAATLSGESWNAISNAINEVETLLEGTDATTRSLFSLMEAAGYQNAVTEIRTNINTIRNNITARDADLLEINLGKLDGNFKREIPQGLEVNLGLNFSDGD